MTTAAVLIAHADPALSDIDRTVLGAGAGHPAGRVTLDELCAALPQLPRPHVFAAVARLEDLRYLPVGAIR